MKKTPVVRLSAAIAVVLARSSLRVFRRTGTTRPITVNCSEIGGTAIQFLRFSTSSGCPPPAWWWH